LAKDVVLAVFVVLLKFFGHKFKDGLAKGKRVVINVCVVLGIDCSFVGHVSFKLDFCECILDSNGCVLCTQPLTTKLH